MRKSAQNFIKILWNIKLLFANPPEVFIRSVFSTSKKRYQHSKKNLIFMLAINHQKNKNKHLYDLLRLSHMAFGGLLYFLCTSIYQRLTSMHHLRFCIGK